MHGDISRVRGGGASRVVVGAVLLALAAAAALSPAPARAGTQAADVGSAQVTGTVVRLVDGDEDALVLNAAGRLVDVPPELTAGLASGDTVTATIAGVDPAAPASEQIEQAASGDAEIIDVDALTRASITSDLSAQINGTRTLVLAPTYAGSNPAIPLSTLEALGTNVATWVAQQTGGLLTLNIVVKPWKQVASYSDCQTDLFNNALAAHGIAAPSSTGRIHVAVILPVACSGWAGLGSLGGREIWIGGDLDPSVLAHEFGHNLGLEHSNRLRCPEGVIRGSGSCTEWEYGDEADTMGASVATGYADRLNSAQVNRLGLLQSVAASTTQTTTATLEPIQATSGVRALRIPITGGALFVEYRPDVRDLGSPVPEWSGVQVREMRTGSPMPLILEAGATSTLTDVSEIPLDPTAGTVLPGTGLAISVVSVGPSAVVRTVPVSSDTVNPTPAVLSVPADGAALPPGPVTFTWTRGSDSGSGLAGERLVITDTGPFPQPQRVLPVPPGATSMVVDDLEPTTYTWQVVSEDRVGRKAQTGVRSLQVDGDAPAGTFITSSWDTCSTSDQTVSWLAAQDASGPITYRLLVDGTVIRTTTTTSTTVAAADLGPGPGGREITLEFQDVVGNTDTSTELWVVDGQPPAAPVSPRLQPGPAAGTWLLSVRSPGANDGYPPSVEYAVNGYPYGSLSGVAELTLEPSDVVTVRSVDGCGLASADVVLGPAQRGTLDLTPPSAPVVTAPQFVGWQQFPVTWTPAVDAESGVVAYDVLVDGQLYITVSGSTTSALISSYAAEAVVTVRARNAQDLTAESAGSTVRLDVTPPSDPEITSPASGATVTSPFVVSWTPSTDSGSGLAGYRLTVGETIYSTGPGTTSLPVTADGRVGISLEAIDARGNTACCGYASVIADGTAPGAPGASLSITGDTSVDAGTRTFTITGQSAAPAGAGRAVRIWFERTGSTVQMTLARVLIRPSGAGSFSAQIPVSLLGSGTLKARVDEPSGFAGAEAALPLTVSPVVMPPLDVSTTELAGWPTGTLTGPTGATVTYWVQVLPGTGRSVRLERRTCGTCAWSTYLSRTTNSSSLASLTVPVQAGTRYWRVRVLSTATASGLTSGTLTVIPATTISGWSTTTVRAAAGTAVTRTVTVSPVKQRPVTLQYRTCTTCAWKAYRTITTSTLYKATFRIPVVKGTRYWRVYAPLVYGGAARATPARTVIGR